jgi:predicted MFS family arabinose efflux permease
LRQGEILGVNQAAASIARIVGPILGNLFYGSRESGHVTPYYAGGFLLALAFVIALAIPRAEVPPEPTEPGLTPPT